ncbi:MAG TPA: cyclic nucleotide-binding domain-containing protein [Stellaceae bacterium]|nr:cyclic nucleotide-binding domain-containing protein [Stellaceae bacterium]
MRVESPADALPRSLEAGSGARDLAAGEVLFRQGDRPTAIYRVESGRLRLVRRTLDDHLVILHTARPGDFFKPRSSPIPITATRWRPSPRAFWFTRRLG